MTYGICDKCEGITDITEKPGLDSLIMVNITPTGENEYWAKNGDTIRITFESSVLLAAAPTVKLQNIEIKAEDFTQDDLKWTIDIDTAEYAFVDGIMNIQVSDIRSMWGVVGEPIYNTSDGNYITFDSVKPEYIYVPEN